MSTSPFDPGQLVRVTEIGCDCRGGPRCEYRFHRYEGAIGRIAEIELWHDGDPARWEYQLDFGEGTYGPFYPDELEPR